MPSIKDFEVIATLGSGSFSSVYKVKRTSDGQLYALKKVKLPSLSAKEKENALNEVRILASIQDKNIIGYKEAFYDDASQSLCIVMEHASGGDLLKKINDHKKKGVYISEDTIWSYLIQMVKGLRTLHNMKILHRDLKCANIFLGDDGNTIKLGDLNVSKITYRGLAHTQAGTPYYCSPEVWQDKPYGVTSDIWSLGCIMYELCALLPPFRAQDMKGLYTKVLKGTYEKIPSLYSQELGKIISMCLQVPPQMRPNCDRLLIHPYLISKMTVVDLQDIKKAPATIDLLDTIKMPQNLNRLRDILPKANYNKDREVVSMIDLDEPSKIEDEIRRAFENRPASRLARANSNKIKPTIIENPNPLPVPRKESNDDSIERILRGRDGYRLPSARKPTSLPPTEVQKKPTSLNPIQRAANAILIMDIFKKEKKVTKLPPPSQIEQSFMEEIVRPPVISKPGSRGGYRGIEAKDGRYALPALQNGNKIAGQQRAFTPTPPHRKGSDDSILKREYVVDNNGMRIRLRKAVKPIY